GLASFGRSRSDPRRTTGRVCARPGAALARPPPRGPADASGCPHGGTIHGGKDRRSGGARLPRAARASGTPNAVNGRKYVLVRIAATLAPIRRAVRAPRRASVPAP